ncbi:hypothetical protein [Pedobacter paludis]|uniref:Uncharacterized protein n=1 Tax=Pedobacter paludis TaxID=2203212 RepID=A0A317F2T1_9SPHI|nr:hypothetical protein [Pedobacter paludis]PWS31798.1 hypothetical protein DF947_08340 [Pedobacter paludis]
MKNLELQNFSVVEMDTKEMCEQNGGINPFLGFAVAYILAEAALNPRAHYKAFMEGWNSK